jgi:hypothetical protein
MKLLVVHPRLLFAFWEGEPPRTLHNLTRAIDIALGAGSYITAEPDTLYEISAGGLRSNRVRTPREGKVSLGVSRYA